MRRHVWGLVAAAGIALVAYGWAEDNNYDEPELFGLGAGAVVLGAAFWRDPPDLSALK